MEIKFPGFGLTLTVDEIKQMVYSISNNAHKDKKNLCLLLSIANETILAWYSAITDMFSPQLALRIEAEKRQITDKELSGLVHFIQQRDLATLVSIIEHLLRQAENHYRDKGEKELAYEIGGIIASLSIFSFFATGRKTAWLADALNEGAWDVRPQEIFHWEMRLDRYRQSISDLIGSVEIKLECAKEMVGRAIPYTLHATKTSH